MRKVRLEVEDLVVVSFETGAGQGAGTVRAHQETYVLGGCGDTASVPVDACVGGGGGGTLNPGPAGCGATFIPQPCGTQAQSCNGTCVVGGQTGHESCGSPSWCCATVAGHDTCYGETPCGTSI